MPIQRSPAISNARRFPIAVGSRSEYSQVILVSSPPVSSPLQQLMVNTGLTLGLPLKLRPTGLGSGIDKDRPRLHRPHRRVGDRAHLSDPRRPRQSSLVLV